MHKMESTISLAKPLPRAKGIPLFGNVFSLATDLSGFLTDQYKTVGPVFTIRLFNREVIVLAGTEANLFANNEGSHFFRSKEFWQANDAELGATQSMISVDGPDHLRLRKVQRPGYSRSQILNQLDSATAIVKSEMANWPLNTPLPAHYSMQRIVTEQLSVIASNYSSKDDIDTIIKAVHTILSTTVSGQRPKFFLRLPGYQKAKKRFFEMGKEVIEAHSPELRKGKPKNLVDALVALHNEDPEFLPYGDMLSPVMGPFIAGLDTAASTTSFILYAILKYPGLMEQVTAEADFLFEGDGPTGSKMRELDVIHRVAMESMRKWPIAPALFRTTTADFEFARYKIPANRDVILATTVPHFLEEFYPDPDKFDIDRFTPERKEHKRPGAYSPFGVGPHRCLGQGLAEMQMGLIIATLFHYAEVKLSPHDYELRIDSVPTPSPDSGMKLKIVRWRNPIK